MTANPAPPPTDALTSGLEPPPDKLSGPSAERFWSTLMRARVSVAVVLLGLQLLVLWLGNTADFLSLLLCTAHASAALAAWAWLSPQANRGLPLPPWLLTVGIDLLVFMGLQSMQHGALNYTLLFALPVLMAAILGPQQRALATAALVTLFLLGDAVWTAWLGDTESAARFFQTAIAGTGFFLVSLLGHQLAVRLAREEALAERSQLAARTQVAVNELIIESMADGVLVLDEKGLVRTANPAARQMLGDDSGPTPSLFLLGALAHCLPLVDLVNATFTRHAPQEGEVQLEASPALRRRLRVHTRPTSVSGDPSVGDGAGLCVVFLEDLHELEARVRSEKLAGMGRMSVAVAHEIRNPLAAIAQANALLQEDLQDPQQQRLVTMVANQTQRLNRIVEDVLNVVRMPSQPAPPDTPVTELDTLVRQTLDEWRLQHPACADRLVWQGACGQTRVRFDPDHLRRVLFNLLDNAHRYASLEPGAIQVSTRADGDQHLRLSVWSDGTELEHSVRRHLFEPFFSSESRSTGMGLYLCRELCSRYHATLDYQRSVLRQRPGNEFFLRLPPAVADSPP